MKDLDIYTTEIKQINKRERENFDVFWFFEVINKNGDVKWKIDHRKFVGFLFSRGYRRYDIGKDYIFIIIKDKVIDEVSTVHFQDEVITYIDKLDENFLKDKGDSISREELLSKFYTSPSIFFNERKLSLLGPQPNLEFNVDTQTNCYIYYENGFVKCSDEGYELHPYSELEGYIFKKQIKKRRFKKHTPEGMFKQFVFNISGKDEQRFLAIRTMIGYLLHSFFDTKMKAVNLTDSSISDVAEGRTGKTLLGNAISHIKNVCEISGKDFDPKNKHKYATASLDTQILFLNDLRKKFYFENLFNDISDAITVDRKNMQPFSIRAKIHISSNDTFRVEGASAKDRVIEYEPADHYNAQYSPLDEFGVWFFTDWDEQDWLSFDNFMMECITLYFQNGVIEAKSINLEKRKQIQHTNPDFASFMEEKVMNGEIKVNTDYDKQALHREFLNNFPEYKEDRLLKSSRNFTKYLKIYANYSSELKGEIFERRSNGKNFIRFANTNEIETQFPF